MIKNKYILNNFTVEKPAKVQNEELETNQYDGHFGGDVFFTKGPLSINQFQQFSSRGLLAIKLWYYIRTKQGLVYHKAIYKGKDTSHLWVYMDNKNLYEWVGLHQSDKWSLLKKLKQEGLIDYKKRGSGKTPLVKIVCDKKSLN